MANNDLHAFLWRNGAMEDLGNLGGSSINEAFSVNSKGEIVGRSKPSGTSARAFLWRDGAMQDLGTLIGGEATALDINDNSQIVGYSVASYVPSTYFRKLAVHGIILPCHGKLSRSC
jgi:probable HAF family extracellular repeat protein